MPNIVNSFEALKKARGTMNPREYAVLYQALKADHPHRRDGSSHRDEDKNTHTDLSDMPMSELEALAGKLENTDTAQAKGFLTQVLREKRKRKKDNVSKTVLGINQGEKTLEAPTFDLLVEGESLLCIEGFEVAKATIPFDHEDGDLVTVSHDGVVLEKSTKPLPTSASDIDAEIDFYREVKKHTDKLDFVGPEDAPLLFVAAAPTALEIARKTALIGDDAKTFIDRYLSPLGLKKSDVAIGFVMPTLPMGELSVEECILSHEHLIKGLQTYTKARVVTLGHIARKVFKSAKVESFNLPHPSAVRRHPDNGEVGRKMRKIAKALDVELRSVPNYADKLAISKPAPLADVISETRKTGSTLVRVSKSVAEKQIVSGVVLDPYDVDLQDDWVPPSEIESTAHGFMKKSRLIGLEHASAANAVLVESHVMPYPSKADYDAAMRNEPHTVIKSKFGDDIVHSGAWVAGVQLGDKEWAMHKEGKLNAFSVGGYSYKTEVSQAAMPKVKFIELDLP